MATDGISILLTIVLSLGTAMVSMGMVDVSMATVVASTELAGVSA